jgi:Cytochrome c2
MGRSRSLAPAASGCGAWSGAPCVAAALLLANAVLATSATASPSTTEGQRVFDAHCAVCHSTDPGFHKEGPSLAGVYGRRAGTAPFFPRYRGLKGSQVVWNEQTLDAWLADPRAFLDGRATSMSFKLTDPEQRAAVIGYLRSLR